MFDYSIYIFTWYWAFSKHDFPVRKSVQRSCRGAPMRCWSPSAVTARTRFDPVEAPFVFADFVWWRSTPPQRNDGSFRLLWRIHNIIYIHICIYIYTYTHIYIYIHMYAYVCLTFSHVDCGCLIFFLDSHHFKSIFFDVDIPSFHIFHPEVKNWD